MSEETAALFRQSGDLDLPYKAPLIGWFGRTEKKADEALQKVANIIEKENPGIDIEITGIGAGKQTNRGILIDGEKRFEIVLDSGKGGNTGAGNYIFGHKFDEKVHISELSGTDLKIASGGRQFQETSEQVAAIQPWGNPGRVRTPAGPGKKDPSHKIEPDEGRRKDTVHQVLLGKDLAPWAPGGPHEGARAVEVLEGIGKIAKIDEVQPGITPTGAPQIQTCLLYTSPSPRD